MASRKYKLIRRRYNRIGAEELSRRINALGLSARGLATLTGAAERRVMQWLDGSEDIPPHVDLLTLTWAAFPSTLKSAVDWAEMTSYVDDKDLIDE